MTHDNVIDLNQSGEFRDQLTEILREWAQKLVLQAVEAEFACFFERYSQERLCDGRARVVMHGHLPECKVMTDIGVVPVKVPRSRDRQALHSQDSKGVDRIAFISQLLPALHPPQ